MTKTPKNGSSSSTPTPGGGPASVGGSGAPPSVGSTKSEPAEVSLDAGNTPGNENANTPHSLPENATSKEAHTNEESNMNGGGPAGPSNDNLLCDTNSEAAPSGAAPGGGPEAPNDNVATSDNISNTEAGAQVKQEDVKPNASTPMGQNASGVLPSDTDLFDGFDSKDGGMIN